MQRGVAVVDVRALVVVAAVLLLAVLILLVVVLRVSNRLAVAIIQVRQNQAIPQADQVLHQLMKLHDRIRLLVLATVALGVHQVVTLMVQVPALNRAHPQIAETIVLAVQTAVMTILAQVQALQHWLAQLLA